MMWTYHVGATLTLLESWHRERERERDERQKWIHTCPYIPMHKSPHARVHACFLLRMYSPMHLRITAWLWICAFIDVCVVVSTRMCTILGITPFSLSACFTPSRHAQAAKRWRPEGATTNLCGRDGPLPIPLEGNLPGERALSAGRWPRRGFHPQNARKSRCRTERCTKTSLTRRVTKYMNARSNEGMPAPTAETQHLPPAPLLSHGLPIPARRVDAEASQRNLALETPSLVRIRALSASLSVQSWAGR